MNTLNKNLIKIILDYTYPQYKSDIDTYKIFLDYCCNIDSNFFSNNVLIFNKLLAIIEKYTAFKLPNENIIGTEQLIDMLYTGYTTIIGAQKFSFAKYNNDIETDIKFCIMYHPLCVNVAHNVDFSERKQVPPLFIACINDEIPLNIIKLLKNKTTNFEYLLCGVYKTNIIEDLGFLIHFNSRYKDILNILKSQS